MSLLVETLSKDRVTVLLLNAPARRNAISIDMREQLLSALDRARADESCRVIILAGKGDHFCAGGDLRAASGAGTDPARTARGATLLQEIVRRITGPKPIVAAVEGSAFGAGLSLVTACDFVIAAATARFCASFAKVGLSADAGLTWSLPQRIGVVKSRQLMITAKVVTADEGLSLGLVDQVTPTGGALAAAHDQAQSISELAPLSVAAIKLTLRAYPYSLHTALQTELEHQMRLVTSADYAEGRAAFVEQRLAVFRGV